MTLLDFDRDGEDKVLAAICYPHTNLPEASCSIACAACRLTSASRWCDAYVGDRTNRRHKPGRAFERTGYRFDVLGDYGAFRDLQRHRMLTIEWQPLTPRHGYDIPEAVVDAGLADAFDDAMERSAVLHDVIAERSRTKPRMRYRSRTGCVM